MLLSLKLLFSRYDSLGSPVLYDSYEKLNVRDPSERSVILKYTPNVDKKRHD